MTDPLPTVLRRRIAGTAVSAAVLVLLGLTVVFLVTDRMNERLTVATARFVEEQRVADRIGQATVRQLVAASTGASRGDPAARAAFDDAGEQVYSLVQDYLFRSLSAEERLQLESIKRAHQRLEVEAARSADLEARGDLAAADSARAVMFEQASSLLASVEGFMRLREQGLLRLRADQTRHVRTLFLMTGLVALALVAGSLLAGRFLHSRVSRPLSSLAGAAARIGRGELAARVNVLHDDEIGAVGRSFNRMAESLVTALQRLERRNEELAGAIARIRETQEELVQAEKMGALGRMTAGLAHELNNPLASVLAHVELLAADLEERTDDEARTLMDDHVGPILQESRRARELVRHLLGFARKSDAELGPVSVLEALEGVIGLRRHAFQQAGLDLRLEAPAEEVHAWSDRQRLQDAFLNIVNNALDAMTTGGASLGGGLRIRVTADEACVRVTFDDDGPGFAEPARVFEPFYTTKPVGEGTGLGLALVHRFLDECGGGASATAAPGGGARVVVELPRVEAPVEGAPETAEGDAVRATERAAPAAVSTPAPDTASPDAPPRVLVVEDEPQLRRVQARLLRRMGADPLLAASADEARDILARERVTAVVSDIRMPGESGIELHRWLVEHRPDLEDAFIFVTGDVYDPQIRELAEARPDLFIQKPFEMEEYLARVGALLAGR